MKQPLLQESVLRYLQQNPGRMVTATELADELQLERRQVLSATRLVAQKGLIKKDGTFFAYVGDETRNGGSHTLYELLATAKNGDLVLQNEDGDVIIARPQ